MQDTRCGCNNLYILSFTVGAESGLALAAAPDEYTAKQLLRNSGARNCCPDGYQFVQVRNLGLSSCPTFGLLLESYVNALVAYDAIVHMADKFLKGEPGDSVLANMYVDDELYLHIVENEYVLTPRLSYDQETGYLTIK